jgi:hypothetical protein
MAFNKEGSNKGSLIGAAVALFVLACLLAPLIGPKAEAISITFARLALKPLASLKKPALFLEITNPDREEEGVSAALKEAGIFGATGVLGFVGSYYRYVFLPFYGLMFYLSFVKDPYGKFSTGHSMWSLLVSNSSSFPCLMPIVKTGPITDMPLCTGPWRLAESPILFVARISCLLFARGYPFTFSELIDEETGLAKQQSQAVGRKENLIDQNLALREFVNQLGSRFNGTVSDLIPHRRYLACAFIAHYRGEKDLAYKIFDELSLSWDPKTLEVTSLTAEKYLPLCDDFSNPLLEVHKSFQNVWFMALLKLSRTAGVLPSSLWIWVKPTDRVLFYTLNQVGGRAAWVEACGPFAHFIEEKKKLAPLEYPRVEQAVRSLVAQLKTEGWLSEEEDPKLPVFEYAVPGMDGDEVGFYHALDEVLAEEERRLRKDGRLSGLGESPGVPPSLEKEKGAAKVMADTSYRDPEREKREKGESEGDVESDVKVDRKSDKSDVEGDREGDKGDVEAEREINRKSNREGDREAEKSDVEGDRDIRDKVGALKDEGRTLKKREEKALKEASSPAPLGGGARGQREFKGPILAKGPQGLKTETRAFGKVEESFGATKIGVLPHGLQGEKYLRGNDAPIREKEKGVGKQVDLWGSNAKEGAGERNNEPQTSLELLSRAAKGIQEAILESGMLGKGADRKEKRIKKLSPEKANMLSLEVKSY